MKKILVALVLLFLSTASYSQESKAHKKSKKGNIVEAACGMCKFDMKGQGCELAVRINGTPYYVEGAKMSDYGNPHGDDGMCNAIRKAKVKGEVKDGKFMVSSFQLLPLKKQ